MKNSQKVDRDTPARVLILTISAGAGHNSTAKALSDKLTKEGFESLIIDAYKFINPLLSGSVEKGYLLSTQYTPKMYGTFYRLAEKKERFNDYYGVAKFANGVFGRKLLTFIKDYNPKVIISTHIFAAQMITAFRDEIPHIRSIGIVTDYTIHPFWEDTVLDYYVTASHLLLNQCIKKGIAEERVLPIGIPIADKFTTRTSAHQARQLLGINNKHTILVMMGSMGYGNLPAIVSKIDTLSMDFQILCVCGSNHRAKRRIDAIMHNHTVYTYGFTDKIDMLMDASDFIITKPGGLTISESLAKGLPLILVNPIPGQEDRNLEFLLNNGIATAVTKTFPIDEAVYQLFSNKWRSECIGAGVSYIGKPDATQKLCQFISQLVLS